MRQIATDQSLNVHLVSNLCWQDCSFLTSYLSHKTIMVSNTRGLFFWCSLFTFSDTRNARISGVRRTKHDVLPNKRSVMASNSFHRQCLQLEPFCKVCGAWFNKNSKKIFAVTTMQPSSTFFGVNTAEDKFILSGRRPASAIIH